MGTILAIDDDKTTLGILESQLTDMGYRVFTERAAVKGIEIAKAFNPDVILLDLHMPVMDGFGVLSALKKDKATKDIPVLMLTGNKEKETVVEAMRHGIVDYIIKPHDPAKLNLKIKAAIQYSSNKKNSNYDDFITLNRRGDMAIIVMRGSLGDKGFQHDLRTVCNPFLLKQVSGKVSIFDIRSVSDMTDDDLFKLADIVKIFSGSQVKIVTGKHYGNIVAKTELEEHADLFLSFGDLELSLNTSVL